MEASPPGRPRILLVSASLIFGGGEVYYTKLAKILSEKYELAAVAFNPTLQAAFENLGLQVWNEPIPTAATIFRRYILFAKCIRKAIRQYRPELVHLNGGPEVFLAWIPRLCGVPVIISYHTSMSASLPLHKRWLLSSSFFLSRKVICVSETVRKNLYQYAWATNTIVISNWLGHVPEEVTRPSYDGARPFRLLFVGRMEEAKGIFDLLHAMRFLENVSLDIVGDGPDMARAQRECVGLPVRFHGFQPAVGIYYRNGDLLAFPSPSEGQGLVLIEAMAYGLPCLISDIEATIETTGNGRFAEIFRCGDPSDLARKIRALQDSQSRLAYLSEHGSQYALETYTEERVRPMYLNLIDSILGV
jgi:glycosyltransferase involved in cell wall biosynthesis